MVGDRQEKAWNKLIKYGGMLSAVHYLPASPVLRAMTEGSLLKFYLTQAVLGLPKFSDYFEDDKSWSSSLQRGGPT